jgi:hypothetical protein
MQVLQLGQRFSSREFASKVRRGARYGESRYELLIIWAAMPPYAFIAMPSGSVLPCELYPFVFFLLRESRSNPPQNL